MQLVHFCRESRYNVFVEKQLENKMSRGTTVSLLRIFPGRKLSKPAFRKLAEKEKQSWGSCLGSAAVDKPFVPPKLVFLPAGKDFRETAVVRDTREIADVLLSWDFTSSFTSLAEIYNLSYCQPDASVAFIPEADIAAMRVACSYLLSNRYSEETDLAFASADVDWLQALANPSNGESYWPWTYRGKPDLLKPAMEDDDGTAGFYLRRLKLVLDVWQSARPRWPGSGEKLALAVQVWG